jgi:hypothetical protein
MKSKELNRMLLDCFPNLHDQYYDEVRWQEGDDTGSHIVYGDVLTPYFTKCIEEKNEIEVVKILNFIEHVLGLNNKYSDEVIAFSVLEGLENRDAEFSALANNYGKLTKNIVDELRNRKRE